MPTLLQLFGDRCLLLKFLSKSYTISNSTFEIKIVIGIPIAFHFVPFAASQFAEQRMTCFKIQYNMFSEIVICESTQLVFIYSPIVRSCVVIRIGECPEDS